MSDIATNLNSYQVQNLVLPELTKASEWIQGGYDLSTDLKSVLPSSTGYKNYVNALPNKIHNIKSKINSINLELQNKLSNATKIESSLNSKMDVLLSTLVQMNPNIEGSAVLNYENSEVVKSTFEQSLQANEKSYETVARSFDIQINQIKTEMENNTDIQNLDKQISDIQYKVNHSGRLGIRQAERDKLQNQLKQLENQRKILIRSYTRPIEELEKEKKATVNYVQSLYYSNLTNNFDFSLETTVKELSKEEKDEMAKLYEALAAQTYTEDIYDYNKIKSSEIGRLNLNWKLIKGVYDKGFTIFDLILTNPEILESDLTLSEIAKSDSKGQYSVGDYAHMLYFMSEEERNIALYLYNTEGTESANEYFNFKIKEINNREGTYDALQFLNELDPYDPFGNIEELIKEGTVDGIGNFVEGLDNAAGGVDGIMSPAQYKAMYIVQWLSCEDIDSIDYLSQEAKNKLKQIQSTMPKELRASVYEISSSIGNMLPAIAISVGVSFVTQNPSIGSKVGAILMGISAGGNATESMVQQGYDLNQAIFYGTMSGLSEAALGYFLGKIPGLSKIDDIPGLKGYFSNILSEGGEEALQAVIDPFLQSMAFGTKYNVNWDEVVKSGIYGMITAGIMNGGSIVINGVNVAVDSISNETIAVIASAESLGHKIDYTKINDKNYINSLKKEIGYQNSTETTQEINTQTVEKKQNLNKENQDSQTSENTETKKVDKVNIEQSSKQNTTSESKTNSDTKIKLSDLKYKSTNMFSHLVDYLKSNINKYRYTNTNSIEGLNEQIKQNGLYHFTTSADAILESGYMKATDENLTGILGLLGSSYGNPKTFFFSGIPDVGAFTTNLDGLPLKTEAVKINPTDAMLNSEKLKVRQFDDGAISWDGRVILDGMDATKEYFILVKEGNELVYKAVSKEIYDSYDSTKEGKAIAEFVSKKSNIRAIQQDYLASLSMKSTNANTSTNFESAISTTESLEDTGATIVSTPVEIQNLNKMEKFFKYDLQVKQLLVDSAPLETYKYNKDSLVEYSDKLFEAIDDTEFYINKMLESYDFSEEDKSYFKSYIGNLKTELMKCGYDYNKLSNFYEIYFSNMSEELVNKVGTNIKGDYLMSGVSLSEAKSINEILHIVHQTVVNNENNYRGLPVLAQKQNVEGNNITLYGKQSELGQKIYDSFSTEIESDFVEIMSLSNNKVLLMVRDVGHALSIEVEQVGDKCYVRYFIPKICNVDMVNELKGVKKVTLESNYTVGVFETNTNQLSSELMDFIDKVPGDVDTFSSQKRILQNRFTKDNIVDNIGLYNYLKENGYINMSYEEVLKIFKNDTNSIITELLLTSLEIPKSIRGKNINEIATYYNFKVEEVYSNVSSHKARSWYLWQEQLLREELKSNTTMTITEKAEYAFNRRNELRIQTREMMRDVATSNYLKETEPNHKYEEYFETKKNSYIAKHDITNLTEQEINEFVCEEIVESATHSRGLLNDFLGIEVND